MKKLSLAIIGQGRSGRNIHGLFYRGEDNVYFDVKYVVDEEPFRRERAEKEYPGCKTFADYRELFNVDVDLVVNSTYSNLHYEITKDLLLHGKNVLVEKPFARSRYECDEVIKIAKDKGLVLAVFQQTFYAPFYTFAYDLAKSGKLGDIQQITIRYNGFSRRWDWQTLQKRCAGGLYNTGPHPVGLALGFLDFDKNAKVVYSKLASTPLTSGDGDDYCKIIIEAPNKPVVDVEVSSNDAYTPYNVKIQGTKGCFKATPGAYEMVYVVDGENPERPPVENFLANDAGDPIYCGEALVKHEESGTFKGTAFDVGTATLYKELYYRISEGKPMAVTAEMAADVISVIEKVHAENPLPLKF